jgi:DNA-binding transcriptional ArsR family regulator
VAGKAQLTYNEGVVPAGAPPVTDVFGVIAHPVRRQIIVDLASGEKPVRDIAKKFSVTRPAVSQHLRVMLDVGLVSQEWVGRESRYRLHPEGLDEMRRWLVALDASWAGALSRLGQHLEGTR